jgi:uncharacterized protein
MDRNTGQEPAGDRPGRRPGHVPLVPGGEEFGRIRGSDLLLVIGITAALLILISWMIDDPALTVGFVVAMLAIQSAVPITAVYLVVIRGRGLSWTDIGFREVSKRWYLRAALIALAMLPAVALVNLATQALLGGPYRNPQLEVIAPEGFSWTGLAAMLVMIGIVAPIVEEVVFRGLLYGWLRHRLGIAASVTLSALAFAGVHGIAILIPALAVTGVILALVYERSRSLWPPIIVHGIFNTIMTLALYAALAAGMSP